MLSTKRKDEKMKRCEKCRVDVAGDRKYCPLCQNELGEAEGEVREAFPRIPTIYHQYNLFFRILILVSIVAGVTCVTINLLVPDSGWWSVFVVAGFICLWVSLAIGVRKRKNIPKNMMYQVVVLSLLGVGWDLLTGWRGWSLDYLFPIVCMCAMLTFSILYRVLHMHLSDVLIYLILDAFFGILPVVFFFTGLLRVPYPSLICAASSVISLSVLLLFEGESLAAELRRRLHV